MIYASYIKISLRASSRIPSKFLIYKLALELDCGAEPHNYLLMSFFLHHMMTYLKVKADIAAAEYAGKMLPRNGEIDGLRIEDTSSMAAIVVASNETLLYLSCCWDAVVTIGVAAKCIANLGLNTLTGIPGPIDSDSIEIACQHIRLKAI